MAKYKFIEKKIDGTFVLQREEETTSLDGTLHNAEDSPILFKFKDKEGNVKTLEFDSFTDINDYINKSLGLNNGNN